MTAAVLLAGSTALGQERGDVPPIREYGRAPFGSEGIKRAVARFREAWGDQDTDALRRLHADDVEWINAYGRMFRGAERLADFLETRLFPAFDPVVSRVEADGMQPVSIRHLGDAAVVHLYTEGTRGAARDGGDFRRTHIHLVLENQDDDWRIVHAAIMDVRRRDDPPPDAASPR